MDLLCQPCAVPPALTFFRSNARHNRCGNAGYDCGHALEDVTAPGLTSGVALPSLRCMLLFGLAAGATAAATEPATSEAVKSPLVGLFYVLPVVLVAVLLLRALLIQPVKISDKSGLADPAAVERCPDPPQHACLSQLYWWWRPEICSVGPHYLWPRQFCSF